MNKRSGVVTFSIRSVSINYPRTNREGMVYRKLSVNNGTKVITILRKESGEESV